MLFVATQTHHDLPNISVPIIDDAQVRDTQQECLSSGFEQDQGNRNPSHLVLSVLHVR